MKYIVDTGNRIGKIKKLVLVFNYETKILVYRTTRSFSEKKKKKNGTILHCITMHHPGDTNTRVVEREKKSVKRFMSLCIPVAHLQTNTSPRLSSMVYANLNQLTLSHTKDSCVD